MRKRILIAVVSLAAVGAAWGLYGHRLLQGSGSGGQLYLTTTVRRGTVTQYVSADGNLRPYREATITAPTGGMLGGSLPQVGQTVYGGGTLASLAAQSSSGGTTLPASFTLQAEQLQVAQDRHALAGVEQQLAGLTLRAPHWYLNVGTFQVQPGEQVQSGQTLVNLHSALPVNSGGQFGYQITKYPLTAPVAGTVEQIYARQGQWVKKNAPILRLKSFSLDQELAQDRLTLAKAEYQLANGSGSSTVPVQTPLSGTVLAVDASAGTYVQAGADLFTVADLRRMTMQIDVSELDVNRLAPGDPVQVSVRALPGKSITGRIGSISPLGTVSNGVAVYQATVVLTPPKGVLPGMSAHARIRVAQKSGVLYVPPLAIHVRGGKDYVLVRSGGAIRAVQVQVGIADSSRVEVTRGVTLGETVLTSSLSTVSNSHGPLNLNGRPAGGGPGGQGGPPAGKGTPPAGAGGGAG
ncbi:MAG: efflux RND transporter periplasmic adaptor subunit [Thermaerobacter sp.]|nr:efflux RND transporter periplasmic adaptor subunit [Thermaerobacter sp.]